MCGQRRQADRLITLPLAHVHGVISSGTLIERQSHLSSLLGAVHCTHTYTISHCFCLSLTFTCAYEHVHRYSTIFQLRGKCAEQNHLIALYYCEVIGSAHLLSHTHTLLHKHLERVRSKGSHYRVQEEFIYMM